MLVIDDNKRSASSLRAASCRYYRHCHLRQATAAATTLLPDSSTMSTFDVTSLFLSLPHSLIFDGLSSLLNSPAVSNKDQKVVSELFNICLGMNTLEFNGRFFLKIRGSPMGSPLSTIAAEIVMSHFDRWLVSQIHLGVVMWARYVDDIFCLHQSTDHSPILTVLNSYHPDLCFTHNSSRFNCTSLRHPLTKSSIKPSPQSFSNAIYRIPCNDCPQSYVGETGRTIATRVLEHDRNIRSHDLNIFTFNQKQYKQIKGSPMGSPLSTPLAEIVMREIDNWITTLYPADIILYRRYIDDIIFICTEKQIPNILALLNNYNNNLRFTIEKEDNCTLPFLDIKIMKTDNRLQTTVYYKPTFTPNYIKFSSFCP
ncbi:ACSF2, partial [Cordylochernes scorpioides]